VIPYLWELLTPIFRFAFLPDAAQKEIEFFEFAGKEMAYAFKESVEAAVARHCSFVSKLGVDGAKVAERVMTYTWVVNRQAEVIVLNVDLCSCGWLFPVGDIVLWLTEEDKKALITIDDKIFLLAVEFAKICTSDRARTKEWFSAVLGPDLGTQMKTWVSVSFNDVEYVFFDVDELEEAIKRETIGLETLRLKKEDFGEKCICFWSEREIVNFEFVDSVAVDPILEQSFAGALSKTFDRKGVKHILKSDLEKLLEDKTVRMKDLAKVFDIEKVKTLDLVPVIYEGTERECFVVDMLVAKFLGSDNLYLQVVVPGLQKDVDRVGEDDIEDSRNDEEWIFDFPTTILVSGEPLKRYFVFYVDLNAQRIAECVKLTSVMCRVLEKKLKGIKTVDDIEGDDEEAVYLTQETCDKLLLDHTVRAILLRTIVNPKLFSSILQGQEGKVESMHLAGRTDVEDLFFSRNQLLPALIGSLEMLLPNILTDTLTDLEFAKFDEPAMVLTLHDEETGMHYVFSMDDDDNDDESSDALETEEGLSDGPDEDK